MTPEERAAEIADAGLADNSDYIDWDAEGPNLTPMRLENLIASAIRAAVVDEREAWFAAAERLELGTFRSGWLAEAESAWDNRDDGPYADNTLALIWATRCRELLREMKAFSHDAEYLRSGEASR